MDPASERPIRHKPAKGVFAQVNQPTVVFLTVCTENRKAWLLDPGAHEFLRETWIEASAWTVGNYLLMPDHVHLFCAPGSTGISFQNWVGYWKRMFVRRASNPTWRWQSHCWDRRIRGLSAYREKLAYVEQNPVRKKLVTDAGKWVHKGIIKELSW